MRDGMRARAMPRSGTRSHVFQYHATPKQAKLPVRPSAEGTAGGKPSMIAVVIKYRASSSVPKEAAALRAKPV